MSQRWTAVPQGPFRLQAALSSISLALTMTCMLPALAVSPARAQERPEQRRPSTDEESQASKGTVRASELELLKEEEEAATRFKESSFENISRGGGLAEEAQPISQAPQNVYVITDEDIRHSGAIDLPTVLRRIPGIDVMQMTGADFNVSARGDNQLLANKMLVLVDGRSIYNDAQGQVFWKAIPVTLPEIKRIEVWKGPASAVYGFNAFDGVINIITKSPAEIREEAKQTGTILQFGGGEYGTITSSAVHAGTYKKWGYRLSLGRDQTNQWRSRDSLAFRDHKFNGLLDYAFGDGSRLSFSGGLVDANRFDGPVFDIGRQNLTIVNGHANVLYQRPNFFVRAWWQEWDHGRIIFETDPRLAPFFRTVDRNGNPILNFRQDSYNLEAQHAIQIRDNRLTYGFNYRHNTASGTNLREFTREDRLGFYLQGESRLTQAITAHAGARYDLDTFINPTISPRGAILYKLGEDHTLRASVSVAYRPPTIIETAVDARSITTAPGLGPLPRGVFFGSNNIGPEKIVSYELGYQGWFLKHRVRLRSDLFFNHITDLIGRVRVPAAVPSRSHANNGVADIYGVETGVEFLATSWLSGFINYTYQRIGQHFDIPDLQRGAPEHKINAGLRGEWTNGLNAEAVVHYVSGANYAIPGIFFDFARPPFFAAPPPNGHVGAYTLLNLRVGYLFWHNRAEIAATVFNALNDRHQEHPFGEVLGSRAMGWLTIRY